MTSQTASDHDTNPKQDLHVTVKAPRSPDPKPFVWSKHVLVRDAAAEAATAFGYGDGSPSLLRHGVALDADKQLVAAGVRDGDQLDLLDTGGGV
jgi:hypothetical protein